MVFLKKGKLLVIHTSWRRPRAGRTDWADKYDSPNRARLTDEAGRTNGIAETRISNSKYSSSKAYASKNS